MRLNKTNRQSTQELPITPTIKAFAQSPDRGQCLALDKNVRWAFEEVGQRYDVRLVSFRAVKDDAHRAIQPFG